MSHTFFLSSKGLPTWKAHLATVLQRISPEKTPAPSLEGGSRPEAASRPQTLTNHPATAFYHTELQCTKHSIPQACYMYQGHYKATTTPSPITQRSEQ